MRNILGFVAPPMLLGDHRRRARPTPLWPPGIVALLLGSAYAGLYLAVTLVTTFGGSSGTTFWPAAGVTIAVLLRRPRGEWPIYLAVIWIVEFILDVTVSDVSVALSAGWATANAVEPLIGALLLTRGGRSVDLSRIGDLLRFAAYAVLLGPSIGALIGTGAGALTGFYSLWPAFPRWYAGDATGALVLGPVLLIRWTAFLPDARIARDVGVPLGLGAAAVAVTAPWNLDWGGALPYFLVPMIVVAALRLGSASIALGVGSVAFAVNFMTASGHGPFFIESDQVGGLIQAQAFLSAIAFSGLPVTALTHGLVSAEESDETKTILLRTVAHDIRGPLSAIAGLSETLQMHKERLSTSDQHMLLGRIRRTSEVMEAMVDQMLDLDRLRETGGEPKRRPVHVTGRIDELIGTMAHADHLIHLEPSPIIANIDPVEVDRIVSNLVSNALRHTAPGSRVWIAVHTAGNGIEIVVDDEGPGIPDELKDRLFRSFERGTGQNPGAGIGLALVAAYAERHGGRAWIEDRSGGGASFHVLLPAETIVASGPQDPEQPSEQPSEHSTG